MSRIISKENVKWLIKNYKIYGVEACSEKLGLSKETIKNKADKLKLRLNKDVKTKILSKRWEREAMEDREKYDKLRISINEKMAYILGFIWADGHIKKQSNWRYTVMVSQTIPDAYDIFKFLPSEWGEWKFYEQKPQSKNAKPQIRADLKTRNMFHFFVDNGYLTKSGGNQEKILNKIPRHLHHYFWLGYFDGDGCFYIGRTSNQMSITSTYEQDWSSVENWLKGIGVQKIKIQRAKYEGGGHSKIRVVNRQDLRLIINDLYKNREKDAIGMERKFKIAMEILARKDLREKTNKHMIEAQTKMALT